MTSVASAGVSAANVWQLSERLLTARTDVINMLPNASLGTVANTAGTAWVFGAWYQITSSLTAAITFCGVSSNKVGTPNAGEVRVEIGTGTAGAETVIYDVTYPWPNTLAACPVLFAMPVNIPANTRIACRASQADYTASTICVNIVYY